MGNIGTWPHTHRRGTFELPVVLRWLSSRDAPRALQRAFSEVSGYASGMPQWLYCDDFWMTGCAYGYATNLAV